MYQQKGRAPWWVKAILFATSMYGVVWGIEILVLPEKLFLSHSLSGPQTLFIWQLAGITEIVLGLGLLCAIANPYRNWIPVFMAFSFKLLAPVLFIVNAANHPELWTMLNYMVIDSFIWLLPLGLVLYKAYRHSFTQDEILLDAYNDDLITLDMFEVSNGMNLLEMTEQQPTMVIFLRHFGCTFCREAMHDIARDRMRITQTGTEVVIVHMLEDEEEAHRQMTAHGIGDVPAISDPEGILYKKFKLRKGTFWQLLGPQVWWRAFVMGAMYRFGLGREMGDLMQMPGIFILHHGQVIRHFIHRISSDRPSYVALADVGSRPAA